MAPLLVLVITFILALLITRPIHEHWHFSLAGRIAMAVMLLFTSIGHFVYPEGMALMLPDFIPYKKEVIFITGIIEILAAIGLLIPKYQRLTGWLLIIFLVLILPANIHAAIKQVNLETASLDGMGLNYLWFRIPLQLLLIGWVYWAAVKRHKHGGRTHHA